MQVKKIVGKKLKSISLDAPLGVAVDTNGNVYIGYAKGYRGTTGKYQAARGSSHHRQSEQTEW